MGKRKSTIEDDIDCVIENCFTNAENTVVKIKNGERVYYPMCRKHTNKYDHVLVGPGPEKK